MIYEFSTPYVFDGETFERIELKLEDLTGRDLSKAKSDLNKRAIFPLVLAADADFQKELAVISSGQKVEFFDDMPAKELIKILNAVTIFLNS